MDILLIILGVILIVLGIIGCILPALPGPILAWAALLLLQWTDKVPEDWDMVWTTLGIAVVVHVLDYVVPAMGTKKFGGTKYGVWGATLGLLIGIFTPIPFGVILGPFLGAFIAEMMHQSDGNKAFRAALGSLVGFLFSTGLKLAVTLYFAYLFFQSVWPVYF
ncbi:MAG: DUF456 domain-containing protein [Chlorobi bacterium]|nr:DUF456 domain-containing protein [Chlorobiota bacterium]